MLNEQLTIVIPCKNEKENIIHTIHTLTSQEHLRGIRVIIADSSTDNITQNLITQYRLQNNFFNIEIVKGGYPAEARNNGAQLVITPYVLFLDADVEVAHPIEIYPEYHLVTCKLRTKDKYTWVFRIFDLIQWAIKHHSPFAVGAYMLMNMEVFRNIHGFNPHDKVAEDFHLSLKISPDKFHIHSGIAYTLSRRFQNKGLFYMARLMIRCWINKDNPQFFTDDHGYWQ